MGVDEVTFKVPEVIVNKLAIPKTELADNCKDVPLIVVLKRLAVPFKEDVPVNVAVPPDAVKLPLIIRADAIEKLTLVVIEPVTDNVEKLLVPVPEMVDEAPLIVIVPVLPIKVPFTDNFP